MLSTVTPDEALKILTSAFGELRTPAESCPLSAALGRVLAEDVESPEYIPGFDRSSVDGYAVAAADTFGCGETSPALLKLRGRVEMGRAPDFSLAPGECAAIPTGGQLPEGADAAVMLEYAEDYGGGLIGLIRSAAPGQNVVFRGDDAAPGRVILPAGRRLGAADIGALAAMGITEPLVRRRPIVGIRSTGDELVPPDRVPGPGEVRDVNAPLLSALVRGCGGEPKELGIIRDEVSELDSALSSAAHGCDLVIVTGGSSAGAHDAVSRVIEARGRLLFHGIAMRPGKPAMLGDIGGTPVFGLPGHPGAAYFTARLLVAAHIRSLLGLEAQPRTVRARLTENLPANDGRELFCGVRLRMENGELWAEPIRTKSGLISALAASDGTLRVARDCEGVHRGTPVTIELEDID